MALPVTASDPDQPIWRQVVSGILTLAIVGVVAFGLQHKQQAAGAEPERPRCHQTDGYIDAEGRIRHRNPDFGCRFVDGEGNPLPGTSGDRSGR